MRIAYRFDGEQDKPVLPLANTAAYLGPPRQWDRTIAEQLGRGARPRPAPHVDAVVPFVTEQA